MKSVDGKIIFINIYDLCKNYIMYKLYSVNTLIYKRFGVMNTVSGRFILSVGKITK